MTSSVGRQPARLLGRLWRVQGGARDAGARLCRGGRATSRPIRVAIVDPGATATADARPRLSGRGPGDAEAAERGGGGGGGAARSAISRPGDAAGGRAKRSGTPASPCATSSPKSPARRRCRRRGSRLRNTSDNSATGRWKASSKPAGRRPSRDRRVVARAPALQRLGIMEAVALAVAPFEAGGLGERAEAVLADQHAAGEDVGLDEIGIGRIALEQVVADRDELERGPAAGLQQRGRCSRDRPANIPGRPPRPSRRWRRRRTRPSTSR